MHGSNVDPEHQAPGLQVPHSNEQRPGDVRAGGREEDWTG